MAEHYPESTVAWLPGRCEGAARVASVTALLVQAARSVVTQHSSQLSKSKSTVGVLFDYPTSPPPAMASRSDRGARRSPVVCTADVSVVSDRPPTILSSTW